MLRRSACGLGLVGAVFAASTTAIAQNEIVMGQLTVTGVEG